MQKNMDIRLLAKGSGVPFWKIAHDLGVHESSLIRWLRDDLTDERRHKIIDSIQAHSIVGR
jgi:hypothetical protein